MPFMRIIQFGIVHRMRKLKAVLHGICMANTAHANDSYHINTMNVVSFGGLQPFSLAPSISLILSASLSFSGFFPAALAKKFIARYKCPNESNYIFAHNKSDPKHFSLLPQRTCDVSISENMYTIPIKPFLFIFNLAKHCTSIGVAGNSVPMGCRLCTTAIVGLRVHRALRAHIVAPWRGFCHPQRCYFSNRFFRPQCFLCKYCSVAVIFFALIGGEGPLLPTPTPPQWWILWSMNNVPLWIWDRTWMARARTRALIDMGPCIGMIMGQLVLQ